MLTINDMVNKLVSKGRKIIADLTQKEKVKLALVGFHIGGVVNGYPEIIWATFEHKRNAPNVHNHENVDEKLTPNTVIMTGPSIKLILNIRIAM